MTTRIQVDIEFLLETLDREWQTAAEQLERWNELDDLEQLEFEVEWPLLADWWDRVTVYRSHSRLLPEQERRVEEVRVLICRCLPQLRRVLGNEDLELAGL